MTTPKMTSEQLADVLAAHAKWRRGEAGGARANLSRANLYGANLYGADLSGANLSGANLSGANLSGADLSGANLYGADLYGADLYGADLYGANLSGADLSGANLSGANLSRADLSEANLYGADLSGANLSEANLSGANLYGADLSRANLYGADLSGAKIAEVKGGELALALTEILPREGEVIGWKKCRGGVLVKVRVPPGAKRSNATGRKCRADRVETLEVIGADVGLSMHDGVTEYRVGATTTADGWGTDRMVECDKGLHFWLTREEAEAWTG